MSDMLIELVERLMEVMGDSNFDELQDRVLDYLEGLSFDDYDYFMDSSIDIQIEMLKENL